MKRVDTEFGIFYCSENDLITHHLEKFGAHTRNELMMVLDHIHKDDIVVEIGSHIGTYSIPIAQKLSKGRGHIYCIEADTRNFEFLEKNIQSNMLSDYTTLSNSLIYDEISVQFTSSKEAGNSGANHYLPNISSSDRIVSTTLSNHIAKYNITKIDFLKLDVEGMEYKILESVRDMLFTQKPILYIEISEVQLERYGSFPLQLEQMLFEMDYTFYMNTYKRNSSENYYSKSLIRSLEVRPFFDVLAVPKITQ